MSKNKKNSQNNAKNRSGSSARNSSQNCPGSSSKSGSQNCRNQSDEESDEDGQLCRMNKGARNYVPSDIRWRW